MVRVAWLFMLSKVIELMDTVSSHSCQNLGGVERKALALSLSSILLSGDIYSPEEGWASDLPPCLPPLGASLELVVGDKDCSR